jgi:hypothetical protein
MMTRPSLMPADTPDYMAPAWASCMSWAISEADIRAAFEAETGHQYSPPKNGLERMIDEATGHGNAYVKAFVTWANENVWGALDGNDDDDDK